MKLGFFIRMFDRAWILPSVRRRRRYAVNGMDNQTSVEVLEERQLLAAVFDASPVVGSQEIGRVSQAISRRASQQTIDSPLGPVNLTFRNNGTRIRGTAVVALTPGPTVPNLDLSPIRFSVQTRNLQFTGRFTGTYALAAFDGPTQQFKGTFQAGLDPLNPANVAGHLTVTVSGNPVVEQDFNTPLATLLALFQQQQKP